MFRKLAFLMTYMLFLLPLSAQDDIRNIELTVNASEPTVLDYDLCRLSLSAVEFNPESVTLNIDVENTNESYSIYLFGHAFDEKTLKKQDIVFDKKSYGTTSRNILVCEGLADDNILRIEPNGNRVLTFSDITEPKKKIELPFYIAKYDKGKFLSGPKYLIRQRVKLILNITFNIPDKTDDTYEVIKKRCDEIVSKVENEPVCPDRKHPVSLEEQIRLIQDEIDSLKDEIADIKSENRWKERDEAYKPYKEQLARLNDLEIRKEVCEKCSRKPKSTGTRVTNTHKCAYCSKSPSEILLMLQRTYQELDNRKIKKADALKRIEGAHRAWKQGCSNLKQKMAADSGTKYKVDKYYDAIVNY